MAVLGSTAIEMFELASHLNVAIKDTLATGGDPAHRLAHELRGARTYGSLVNLARRLC
jgi:hypothetical protein